MIKVQISESGGKNAVPGIRRRAAKAPADNARRTSETETQTGQDKTPSFRIDSFERSPFHMPTELSGITGIELPKEKLKELSGELKLAEFHHHYIDWEDTEASFSENSEISIEDSQLLNHRVNRIAALYVTSKGSNLFANTALKAVNVRGTKYVMLMAKDKKAYDKQAYIVADTLYHSGTESDRKSVV